MTYPKKAGLVIAGIKEANNIPSLPPAQTRMNDRDCREEGYPPMNEAVHTEPLVSSACFFRKRTHEDEKNPAGDPR